MMMKNRRLRIAVSLNGEGRGHLTRVSALARRLEKRHVLGFWCPASIRDELAAAFPGASVRLIPGLRFVMKGGEVDYMATAAANLPGILSFGSAVSALAADLAGFRADGVFSDFEPLLPEAASRLGLPILQLNHPGIVTRMGGREPEAQLARLVSSRMMGRFDRLILSSFYEGDVGPIVRPEILRTRRHARRGDYVVVYAKDEFRERLRDTLDRIPGHRFRYFPDPAEDFPSALAGCRAVIAPSGHQMAAEALCLRKPIFAIPISGQYEQRLNGMMLRASGRGDWAPPDSFEEPVRRFLAELDSYPRASDPRYRFRFRDEGSRAARMVEDFFWKPPSSGEARRVYLRVTWPLGRLAASGVPR